MASNSIPSPVIFDILLLLPIKSIARFKALNKLCRSFIRDPNFIRTHFKNGAINNYLSFILSYMEHRNNLSSIIHFVTVDRDFVVNVAFSAPVSFDSYKVLPSCNGLVCFYGLHGGCVHVCNPSTRDISTLPHIIIDAQHQAFRSLSCTGFGFDEISGQYKVIKFLEPLEAVDVNVNFCVNNNLRIEIFTMGNNSWRTIRYHPCFSFPHHQPPVFAGGFFYWITADCSNPDGPPSFSIVSFDIGNEIFEAISPPESISDKKWYNMYLVEMKGQLCLVDLDYQDKKTMDIWSFNNIKGDAVQWTQLATIAHPSEPIDTTRPVAFNGDEILLQGYIKGLDHFNCYNLQTTCFRQLKIKGNNNNIPSQCSHVSHHVESLFPC